MRKLKFVSLFMLLALLGACGGPSREAHASIVTEVHHSETSSPLQSTATAPPILLTATVTRVPPTATPRPSPTELPSPTPSPTPGNLPPWTPAPQPRLTTWDTYENLTYTLRLRYPPTMTLLPRVWASDSEGFQEQLHISLLAGPHDAVLGISVHEQRWEHPRDFLAEMERAAQGDPERMRYPFVKITAQTEVQGRPAVVFSWDNTVTGRIQAVAVAGTDWLYIFHAVPGKTQSLAAQLEVLEGALQSLEILETP